jgi:drug/metabolite transporter (DMT)-like permease
LFSQISAIRRLSNYLSLVLLLAAFTLISESMALSEFRGELAALSAALLWAISSFIYARLGKRLPLLWLNLVKSSIAIGFILITLRWQYHMQPTIWPPLNLAGLGLLSLSGAIGIGFGDSVFFRSLVDLGVRRGLLLEAISPPLTAFLATLFLNERLQVFDWLGIGLTVSGVAWVIVERTPDQAVTHLKRGILFGVLAALAQASGAILSRAGLAGTEISPLWSSLVRLTAGVLVLLVWLLIRRLTNRISKLVNPSQKPALDSSLQHALQPLTSGKFLLVLTAASFCGTYLGIWLQQTALKYTPTGIAQALIATSPLFIIPIAVISGERISFRAVLGALVALIGIWLLLIK